MPQVSFPEERAPPALKDPPLSNLILVSFSYSITSFQTAKQNVTSRSGLASRQARSL
jgi:hypothetical protein